MRRAGRAGVRSRKRLLTSRMIPACGKRRNANRAGGDPSRFQAYDRAHRRHRPRRPTRRLGRRERPVGRRGWPDHVPGHEGASHRRSAERRRARSALSGSADRPRRRRGCDRRRHTGTGARGRGRTDAGATDPDARELERAAANLGLPEIRVVTARRYDLIGDLSDTDVATLTRRLLANDTIEISTEGELPAEFAGAASADVRVDDVPLAELSDDDLLRLSKDRVLSLDLTEMQAIQAHFAAEDVRRPTPNSRPSPRPGPSTVCTRPSGLASTSPTPRPTARSPSAFTMACFRRCVRSRRRSIHRGCVRRSSTTPGSSPSTTTTTLRSRSRPTTTRPRSSRSVARTPVSVVWSATSSVCRPVRSPAPMFSASARPIYPTTNCLPECCIPAVFATASCRHR